MAIKHGLDPEQFWRLTPWQTTIWFDQIDDKITKELMLSRYLAWHTAMFVRAKKIPTLKEVCATAHNKPLTREERIAQMRAALMGSKNPVKNGGVKKFPAIKRKKEEA